MIEFGRRRRRNAQTVLFRVGAMVARKLTTKLWTQVTDSSHAISLLGRCERAPPGRSHVGLTSRCPDRLCAVARPPSIECRPPYHEQGLALERLRTRLEGPILIRPVVHGDERGFFHETYRRNRYADLAIPEEYVQDNHSRSRYGVVRGMHFQVGAGMAKLVRCARGRIFDVVVDLRRRSTAFGEWEAFELSDQNLHQLYCPIGFAHGFCVLSDVADVIYKCSTYYDEAIERGIAYDDPDVGVEWPDIELVPSARDAAAPRLRDIAADLPFD